MARQKIRLATSKEVYNAIRWDPRHDAAAFVIVYEERFSGQREVPLLEFSPDGEIPWHRVWAIRRGSETVWDRSARIDRLSDVAKSDASTPVPAPTTELTELDARLVTREVDVQRFDAASASWRPLAECPATAPAPRQPGLLRVATLNVLNPALAPGVPSQSRAQAIVAQLLRLDADLIALQEATPPLMALLLAQAWVRAHFQVCMLAHETADEAHGQVLLSRLPVSSAVRIHGWRGKHLLLVELELADQALSVAVVHLSSRLASGAPALRAHQLRTLISELEARGHASFILGDFNCDDDELAPLQRRGWRDMWTQLRPDQPGLTFDPSHNAVAAATSRSGLARRYDRVLWRAPAAALSPVDVRLFAERPAPAYASDHFGVVALLRDTGTFPNELQDAAPTYRSALVLLPPESCWAPIQAVRAQHDRSFERWMPHVNLLYGFVPDTSFAHAAALIADALRLLEPFGVELGSFGRFDHRNSSSLWLDPETLPDRALVELQAVLERLFPQCDELSRRAETGAGGFRPHLTVGAFTKQARPLLDRVQRQLEKRWSPIEFEASSLALISRRESEPFVVRERISIGAEPLGQTQGPASLLDSPTQAASCPREAARVQLEALCSEVVPGSALLTSGSVRAGTDLPESDLDLTWVCPAGSERALALDAIATRLAGAPNLDGELTRVEGFGETLRFALGAQALDLQLTLAPPGAPVSRPLSWTHAQRETLSPAGALAIKGLRDAEALERFGVERGCWPLLQASIKLLKRWARARDLDIKALGYLGGISWSVLAASSLGDPAHAPTTLAAMITRVFGELSEWDMHAPFALDGELGEWQAQRRDRLAVLSPAMPRVNTARHVTPSTAQVLAREWQRAQRLVHDIDQQQRTWQDLLEPVDAPSGRRVCMRVQADSRAQLSAARGWLKGHLLGLILALERRCNAQLRPRGRGVPAPWELCLVLESCPAADTAVRAVLDTFQASFPWPREQAQLVLELTATRPTCRARPTPRSAS